MLEERFQRLNALAKINSASKYLEIGVNDGTTFKRVDVSYKVAVDPKFRFNVQDYANEQTIFHEVTSDSFFSSHASKHGKFDLIYLDGLHTFEQTLRDFRASLEYSHQETIWLIDDTYPTGRLATLPSLLLVRIVRRLLGINDRRWMGDVFKVVFAIHDFFPQFSYATFPGHGQTVVWPIARDNVHATWNSLKKITRLGYEDFLQFRDSHLSVMEPSEILEILEEGLKLIQEAA